MHRIRTVLSAADDYRGWAGNTDRGYMKYAVCDRNGPRSVQCEALVPGVFKSET